MITVPLGVTPATGGSRYDEEVLARFLVDDEPLLEPEEPEDDPLPEPDPLPGPDEPEPDEPESDAPDDPEPDEESEEPDEPESDGLAPESLVDSLDVASDDPEPLLRFEPPRLSFL
ncbi:MAG: hypothetical protein ACHQIG_01805 [Acidimicrobiia bacterium]